MEKAKEAPAANAGLRGVVAASSAVGDVNGERGELIYQGYNIHDLAENSNFEEVVFLLWHGRLPKQDELDALNQAIAANYELPAQIVAMMREFPATADPMDVLRTAISALSFYDANSRDTSRANSLRVATTLTAQMATIVTTWDRLRNGQEPVAADPTQNLATNFLYMLRGKMPTAREARIFDICLILHADHELNASTFTGRVVAGTLADIYGAVTAACAALSGPLHGGANTAAMKMLLSIGEPDKVESFVADALANKKKLMGFGHAVYKVEDPRATHLRRFSKEIGEAHGNTKWYEMTAKIEAIMKREKGMYPNVDAYSASTYYVMGIPLDLYTPIFAVSRISGWAGHILEQYGNNKLIRPRAEYIGARDLKYKPIAER